MLFISVAATVCIALSIGLSALELRHLSPIVLSLYLQSISFVTFRAFRINNVNFEVYREEKAAA